jgi:broad specificity phosphatase PhoE
MKIIIVRHAESANNVLSMVSYELYMSSRSSDPSLTEAGVLQAEKVGKFLKEFGFKIDKSF